MKENHEHLGTREQRRSQSPRIVTYVPVKYIVIDDKDNDTDYGEGWAINPSQSGMLLETRKPLNSGFAILLTFDHNDKGMKVKGRLVYSTMQKNTGHCFSGIDFIGPKDQQVAAIVAFVKSYCRSKSKEKSQDSRIIPKEK